MVANSAGTKIVISIITVATHIPLKKGKKKGRKGKETPVIAQEIIFDEEMAKNEITFDDTVEILDIANY
jgi:hypothetical protein